MGDADYGTSGGVELSEERVRQLVDEAELGYDAEQLRTRSRRGRPPIGEKAGKVFHVRLQPGLRDALEQAADAEQTTPSDLVRSALWDFLDSRPAAQARQADLQRRVADKTKELHQREQRIHQQQARVAEQQARRTKSLQEELRRRDEIQRSEIMNHLAAVEASSSSSRPVIQKEFDFFISHASPDKDEVVRSLAEALRTGGAIVFYDEWKIRVGDSLRQRIDDGLARSRYGVVILSRSFLSGRTWTARELNGLFALEEDGHSRILPVWHDVTKAEVAEYSPVLADRAALKTADYTLHEIAHLLIERLGVDAGNS